MIWKTDGTTRRVLIFGGFALKIARHNRGRRCNRFEARIWAEATWERKAMLCPVVACWAGSLVLVMLAAEPLSEEEAEQHRQNDTFPDWDYLPGGEECPFEYKASDWGKLGSRLVAVDYSAPALNWEGEA